MSEKTLPNEGMILDALKQLGGVATGSEIAEYLNIPGSRLVLNSRHLLEGIVKKGYASVDDSKYWYVNWTYTLLTTDK